jgi:hypothetical protein
MRRVAVLFEASGRHGRGESDEFGQGAGVETRQTRRGRRGSAGHVRALFVLLVLVSGAVYGVRGEGPRVEIQHPEPDEAMLQESGALLLAVSVFDWESPWMRVGLNTTVVADRVRSQDSDVGAMGTEMSWEIYGLRPYERYTLRIEFFDEASGLAVASFNRTSLVLPYYDPMLDAAPLEMLYPVPRDHPDYPSVQAEASVIEAGTRDNAKVRAGQALVLIVNSGIAGYFGRMNSVRTTMEFPEESYRRMCPQIVPQLVIAAIFTTDGHEVIGLSDYTLFWAGNFTSEELGALPSLKPIQDDGPLVSKVP